MSDRDIAVLGVGMHPWGKWGRNFVEYGVVAAHAALADAGVEWRDIQFVSGADTVRNGYPGYVAGATFAQALGWNGAQVASSYAACASGVTALAAARHAVLARAGRSPGDAVFALFAAQQRHKRIDVVEVHVPVGVAVGIQQVTPRVRRLVPGRVA